MARRARESAHIFWLRPFARAFGGSRPWSLRSHHNIPVSKTWKRIRSFPLPFCLLGEQPPDSDDSKATGRFYGYREEVLHSTWSSHSFPRIVILALLAHCDTSPRE